MKAIIYERYGSPEVLSMEEIEKPTPKADEVLIEVRATSVNAYDWHLMRADPCIVRASGWVGSFAVQIAKSFGARVSAVASREKLDFVRSLGADELFNYQREDFTRSDRRYDLIFDGAGTVTIAGCKRSLEPRGRCVVAGFSSLGRLFASTLLGPALLRGSGRSITLVSLEPSRTELQLLTDLIVAGKVRPVIDQVYPLKDAAEAIRYIEEGRPRGKIVLTVP
jgi:NADPH:quinone reductase-like Zn-dependent oxidoreductase